MLQKCFTWKEIWLNRKNRNANRRALNGMDGKILNTGLNYTLLLSVCSYTKKILRWTHLWAGIAAYLQPSPQQCLVSHCVLFQMLLYFVILSHLAWFVWPHSVSPQCCWSHTSRSNQKPCVHRCVKHYGLQEDNPVIRGHYCFFKHNNHFIFSQLFRLSFPYT